MTRFVSLTIIVPGAEASTPVDAMSAGAQMLGSLDNRPCAAISFGGRWTGRYVVRDGVPQDAYQPMNLAPDTPGVRFGRADVVRRRDIDLPTMDTLGAMTLDRYFDVYETAVASVETPRETWGVTVAKVVCQALSVPSEDGGTVLIDGIPEPPAGGIEDLSFIEAADWATFAMDSALEQGMFPECARITEGIARVTESPEGMWLTAIRKVGLVGVDGRPLLDFTAGRQAVVGAAPTFVTETYALFTADGGWQEAEHPFAYLPKMRHAEHLRQAVEQAAPEDWIMVAEARLA